MSKSAIEPNDLDYWSEAFSLYHSDEGRTLEENLYLDCRPSPQNQLYDFEDVNDSIALPEENFQPYTSTSLDETNVLFSSADEAVGSPLEDSDNYAKKVSRSVPDLSERLKELFKNSSALPQGGSTCKFPFLNDGSAMCNGHVATVSIENCSFNPGDILSVSHSKRGNNQYFGHGNTSVNHHTRHELAAGSFLPRLKNTTVLGSKEDIIWINLQSFAQAVATFDQESVEHYFTALKVDTKPTGSAIERLAFYSVQALIARYNGTGAECCRTLAVQHENSKVKWSLYSRMFTETPVRYLMHCARVNMILEILPDSATVLHVVDILGHSSSWFSVIEQIRSCPNRILQMKITMVVFMDENIEHKDRNPEAAVPALQSYADSMGLSLIIRVIRCTLREFSLSAVKVPGETLVVNCGNVLGQFPDSSVLKSNPRGRFIQLMSEAEPDLVMLSEMNFDLNTQFFLKRFRTAMDVGLFNLSMLDRVFSNVEERLAVERSMFTRKVTNVIACEGLDRFMRTEEFKSWKQRFSQAGFAVKPMPQSLLLKLKSEGTRFGPEIKVEEVDGAMHVFWNGIPIFFCVSWRMKH